MDLEPEIVVSFKDLRYVAFEAAIGELVAMQSRVIVLCQHF